MPRLPSAEDLGFAPSMDYQRGLASIDTSPIARGAEAKAAGIQKLGDGIFQAGLRIDAKQEKDKTQTDELEQARARSSYLIGKTDLDKARDDETDPAVLQGFRDRYQKNLDDSAAGFSDPKKAELFKLAHAPEVEASHVGAQNRKFSLEEDQSLADLSSRLSMLQHKGAEAKTDADKQAIVDAGRDEITARENAGYLTAQQAATQRRGWANGYAVTSYKALTPQQRVEALTPIQTGDRTKAAYQFFAGKGWSPAAAAGIVGGLVHESGGAHLPTNARNPGDGADGSDSIGIAQWNSDRAEALKAFATARGKPITDFQTQLEFVDHELNTGEGAAAGALRSAKTPREAAAAFVRYERPFGWQNGPAAAAGWNNRLRQAEGVAAAYAGQPLPEVPGQRMADYVTPDQRDTLLHQANGEIATQQRQAQRDRHDQSAALQARMSDDLASIEATGQGNTSLKAEDIAASLGPQAAKDWVAQRGRTRQVHEALDGIESLPEGEVERRLQTLQPRPGADGFTDDMAAYTKARGKAEKFMQARRADPALAVENLPAVKSARAAIQYEGDGDQRAIAPASAQAVVRARLAAQNQLGIPEPMAITKAEAAPIARQLRYIGDDNPAGLKAFVGKLQGTYGEYADEVLSATLQHANINRDLAVATTEALTKIARGTVPNPFDQRRLDRAGNGQQMDDALAGRTAQPANVAPGQAGAPAVAAPGVKPSASAEPPDLKGAPTGQDVGALVQHRADPSVLSQFDAVYGAGTSRRVLAEVDRRLGQSGSR